MKQSRKALFVYLPVAVLLLCAAAAVPAIRNAEKPGMPVMATAPVGQVIQDINTNMARYNPGESVTIQVDLANQTSKNITNGHVALYFLHLNQQVARAQSQSFNLQAGAKKTLKFTWTPPNKNFQGYSIEAWVKGKSGKILDNLNSAVDVSSTWTKFPRYGYISTYPKQTKAVTTQEIQGLKNDYLDGIQFYDWQWKHHVPLAGTVANPAPSWENIDGKTNYRQTVLDAIHAAHNYNMVAMNYNLIYGAWADYKTDGSGVKTQWGLWKDTLRQLRWTAPMPNGWATPAIDIFNPLNVNWQKYIVGQESKVFQAYPFDGWQADQLGNFGLMYDYQGKLVKYWTGFVPLLNYAKKTLKKQIIFNDVGAFGLTNVAKQSNDTVLYVECWPNDGQVTYNDLKKIIDQGVKDSKGKKSIIIAAYMDSAYANGFTSASPGYFSAPGVLLTDATIDASGGDHIELGDNNNMLDAPYYPNHNLVMNSSLKKQIYNYNTFMVAYENLLRGGLQNTSNRVVLQNIKTSQDASPNTVWEFTKSGDGYDVIHLINLMGENFNHWQDATASYPKPKTQKDVSVKYYYGSGTVKSVDWASPDYQNGRSYDLSFQTGQDSHGKYVTFTVPSLQYWDMIYMRKS